MGLRPWQRLAVQGIFWEGKANTVLSRIRKAEVEVENKVV